MSFFIKGTVNRADANELVVLATISSGGSWTTLTKILSGIGCPSLSQKGFYLQEQRVGQNIKELAKQSCAEAANREKTLTLAIGDPETINADGSINIRIKGDGMFGKRSYSKGGSALSCGNFFSFFKFKISYKQAAKLRLRKNKSFTLESCIFKFDIKNTKHV